MTAVLASETSMTKKVSSATKVTKKKISSHSKAATSHEKKEEEEQENIQQKHANSTAIAIVTEDTPTTAEDRPKKLLTSDARVDSKQSSRQVTTLTSEAKMGAEHEATQLIKQSDLITSNEGHVSSVSHTTLRDSKAEEVIQSINVEGQKIKQQIAVTKQEHTTDIVAGQSGDSEIAAIQEQSTAQSITEAVSVKDGQEVTTFSSATSSSSSKKVMKKKMKISKKTITVIGEAAPLLQEPDEEEDECPAELETETEKLLVVGDKQIMVEKDTTAEQEPLIEEAEETTAEEELHDTGRKSSIVIEEQTIELIPQQEEEDDAIVTEPEEISTQSPPGEKQQEVSSLVCPLDMTEELSKTTVTKTTKKVLVKRTVKKMGTGASEAEDAMILKEVAGKKVPENEEKTKDAIIKNTEDENIFIVSSASQTLETKTLKGAQKTAVKHEVEQSQTTKQNKEIQILQDKTELEANSAKMVKQVKITKLKEEVEDNETCTKGTREASGTDSAKEKDTEALEDQSSDMSGTRTTNKTTKKPFTKLRVTSKQVEKAMKAPQSTEQDADAESVTVEITELSEEETDIPTKYSLSQFHEKESTPVILQPDETTYGEGISPFLDDNVENIVSPVEPFVAPNDSGMSKLTESQQSMIEPEAALQARRRQELTGATESPHDATDGQDSTRIIKTKTKITKKIVKKRVVPSKTESVNVDITGSDHNIVDTEKEIHAEEVETEEKSDEGLVTEIQDSSRIAMTKTTKRKKIVKQKDIPSETESVEVVISSCAEDVIDKDREVTSEVVETEENLDERALTESQDISGITKMILRKDIVSEIESDKVVISHPDQSAIEGSHITTKAVEKEVKSDLGSATDIQDTSNGIKSKTVTKITKKIVKKKDMPSEQELAEVAISSSIQSVQEKNRKILSEEEDSFITLKEKNQNLQETEDIETVQKPIESDLVNSEAGKPGSRPNIYQEDSNALSKRAEETIMKPEEEQRETKQAAEEEPMEIDEELPQRSKTLAEGSAPVFVEEPHIVTVQRQEQTSTFHLIVRYRSETKCKVKWNIGGNIIKESGNTKICHEKMSTCNESRLEVTVRTACKMHDKEHGFDHACKFNLLDLHVPEARLPHTKWKPQSEVYSANSAIAQVKNNCLSMLLHGN
jgi:hypothetical protein